jgi:hypothetical protein
MAISLQSYLKNVWAIQKEIKRCIPKGGMPHAPKAYKKIEEKRCIPKEGYATCPQGMSKKREEKKYSPYQKYTREREIT